MACGILRLTIILRTENLGAYFFPPAAHSVLSFKMCATTSVRLMIHVARTLSEMKLEVNSTTRKVGGRIMAIINKAIGIYSLCLFENTTVLFGMKGVHFQIFVLSVSQWKSAAFWKQKHSQCFRMFSRSWPGHGPKLASSSLISANTRVPCLSTVHHPSPLDKGCLGARFTGGMGATVARARVNCGQKREEWVCCAVCNNHTSCLNQEAHGCTQELVEYRKPVCGNSTGSVPLVLCHLSCWT